MSNKTIFKRISLVAVAALGLGVLTSVAPASAAPNAAVGGANAASAAGILNVVTLASITGDAGLSATVTASNTGNFSVGLLSNSTTLSTSSLTSTATMRSDGEIVFYYTAVTSGAAVTVEVIGGTITDSVAASGGTAVKNMNAAKTQMVFGADNGSAVKAIFAFSPNAGVATATVSVYETAAAASNNGDAAAIAAIQAGSVSRGSLLQRYNITVATTSASGAYSAADSMINTVASAATAATGIDEANSNIIANSAA
jgi:hypothetical protein